MDLNKIISSFAKILYNIQCECNIPIANVLYSQSVHNFNKPIDDYTSNWEQGDSDIDINYNTNNKYSKKIFITEPVKIVNLHQVKFVNTVKFDQVLIRLMYYKEMYKFYNQYNKNDFYGLNNISKYINHLNQII